MNRSLNPTLWISLIFFSISPGFADANEENNDNIFTSGRIGLTPSVDLTGNGELHLIISHRFGDINGGFYDLFGLDLATIRLGFDYGIVDRLAVGIGRSTFEKSYDLFTKIAIAKQTESGFPFSITGHFAASVSTMKNLFPEENDGIWDKTSPSGQILIARNQGRLSFQVAPMLFRNNFETRSQDALTLFALPLSTSIKISNSIAITTQYIPVFDKPSFAGKNPLTLGFDIDTGGHHFQLSFSNSTATFEKSLLTNTQGDWTKGRIYFGFNIIRIFSLK